jgi:hypothetical protein
VADGWPHPTLDLALRELGLFPHEPKSWGREVVVPQYKAQSGGVLVWGTSMLGCIQGLEAAGLPAGEALKLLAKGGVAPVEPEEWYPQQPYLDMLREVERSYGGEGLRAMARQVPDTSKFPPGIKTLEDALQCLDIAYQLNHKGGPIGHYACVPVAPGEIVLECANPYGCAFDLGILDALVQRFKPEGSSPQIRHQAGSGCRRLGDPACTYVITW